MAKQTIHGVVFRDPETDQWVAMCLEYHVTTQGDNAEHACEMLKEAVELYLEDLSPEDIEVLYQRIDEEPRLVEVMIDAPTLLRT